VTYLKSDLILGKYRIKKVIIMGPDQEVIVCIKKSLVINEDEEYIINIFKKNALVNLLLPDLEVLKNTRYMYYVEHVLENNKLYAVFAYAEPFKVKQYIDSINPSLLNRLKIANSFFINAMEIKQTSVIFQYTLMNPDNININKYGIVYFSHIFDFRDRKDSAEDLDVVGRLGTILDNIFENYNDLPQSFQNYLQTCKNKGYDNIQSAYNEFRPFLKLFIGNGEEPAPEQNIQASSDIAIMPKRRKKSRKIAQAFLVAISLLILIASLYLGGNFLYKLSRSIQEPVDAQINTSDDISGSNESNPDSIPGTVPESSPAIELTTAPGSVLEPSSSAKPATPVPGSAPGSSPSIEPTPAPDTAPGSSPSAEPMVPVSGTDPESSPSVRPTPPQGNATESPAPHDPAIPGPGATPESSQPSGPTPPAKGTSPGSTPSVEPTPPATGATPEPTPTVKPTPSLNQPGEDKEDVLYTVQKGDWLKEICRKFYGNPDYYEAVAKYNNISDPSQINTGQVIKLPHVEILAELAD